MHPRSGAKQQTGLTPSATSNYPFRVRQRSSRRDPFYIARKLKERARLIDASNFGQDQRERLGNKIILAFQIVVAGQRHSQGNSIIRHANLASEREILVLHARKRLRYPI